MSDKENEAPDNDKTAMSSPFDHDAQSLCTPLQRLFLDIAAATRVEQQQQLLATTTVLRAPLSYAPISTNARTQSTLTSNPPRLTPPLTLPNDYINHHNTTQQAMYQSGSAGIVQSLL